MVWSGARLVFHPGVAPGTYRGLGRPDPPSEEPAMRLCVVNLKGGTGKTVTAVHLAVALAQQGRTLLVDADPQGSALSWSQEAGDFPCSVVGLPVRDLRRRLPA